MKKILKIIGIIAGVMVVLAIVMAMIEEKVDGPKQSFKFINTSDEIKSVTFEKKLDDGTYEKDGYYTNTSVAPGKKVIKRISPGTFKITVWNAQDKFFGKVQDYTYDLPDGKSSYDLIHFDLAMDKNIAIVTLNHLFGGNSIAESMANAVGTDMDLTVKIIYKGDAPFKVAKEYKNRTFRDYGDKLPESIKFGELVYGVVPVPDNITQTSDFYKYCENYILEKY